MGEWRGRMDARHIDELVHDTYKQSRKLGEPTVCVGCGAVYHHGRWTWGARPAEAREDTCPACHRIRDHYPAGFVTLSGAFVPAHRVELLGLVRNLEARERAEHPLKRVIAISEAADAIEITTTDTHLARTIGDALEHAYDGVLEGDYIEDSNLLRLRWQRDA